ncbi:phospho-sugar mutase [Pseudonocardia humida]|uniref:Phospho-sugar mutase n=1 Tax=Pseudonocardia humida TaxID=2800819 RepID=A0ABT0ZVN6_9PSEU|nr:phospho-sugar mutase [Pseudonocardia humida]MCO1654802.1 phospho-sugar mutase [Pseudonocardia humida]
MRRPPSARQAALRWIADDPDPATRTELQELLTAAVASSTAAADLAERMSGPLVFGTAGLRGPVRAGPSGMNVAVVRRATAGLAAWLAGRDERGTVVVGRDARHGSAEFAEAAAGVLAGAGFAVRVLPGPLPTPVLAFAVRELGAVAGVQITASHNPPADNGYKVYLADGAQLAPPSDREIEAAIAAAPGAAAIPIGDDVETVDVTERYLQRVARLPRGAARGLRVALTPLHGVGGATAVEALRRAGFDDVHVVAEQAEPDPAFPTVGFPNPEEPGATDALLALAAEVGADLAVALDPDADRCALAVPSAAGRWRMLTGDETGALLGDHLLRAGGYTDPLVATTVVSGEMLRSVAEAHGARYAETLTGFKWIVRGGPGLVYGYEEALGYCVDPDTVRDKDGIAAAVLACDLAAGLAARGRTIDDRLDELALAHGVHRTEGVSVRLAPAARDAAVERLRAGPPSGWESSFPAPDVLVLRRERERLVIRPSGTEPKLKAYLQVVEPVTDDDLASARARAADRLAELRAAVPALLDPPTGP